VSTAWPRVSLSELIRLERRPVKIEPTSLYPEIGIYCFGRGIFHKSPRTGLEVGAKDLFMMKEGDFILQVTFAWEGAVAVVSSKEDGMYGSTRYPTFRVDESRCDKNFLLNYFKTHEGIQQLVGISPGSAGRNRVLSMKRIPEVMVPLPSLPEQRIVNARIEELSIHARRAHGLRQEAMSESSELMSSKERTIWPIESTNDAPPLESVTSFLARGRQSEQGSSDHFLIKTQHVQQGRYVSTMLRLAPYIAAKVYPESRVQDGDILIACSAAGCLGRVARYKDDGRIASTDTHIAIARPNFDLIEPDYLYAYLRGAQGQYQLRSRERGDWKREKISFRLTELNLSDLKRVPVPVPSRAEQRRIVDELKELESEVNALTRLQDQSAEEISALLPSVLSLAFTGGLSNVVR
jgi:type I restriction enzyme S subunit